MTSHAVPNTGLEREHDVLKALLTELVAAVSQQFLHMLILEEQHGSELYDRIKAVDDVDFITTMQLIGLLVSRGNTVQIAEHTIYPSDEASAIARAELAREASIAKVLRRSRDIQSAQGVQILEQTRAARRGYRAWLQAQCNGSAPITPKAQQAAGLQSLVASLLRLMTQAMLNAYAFWWEGARAEANVSWQICGAAMLYLAPLAQTCRSLQTSAGIPIEASAVENQRARTAQEDTLIQTCETAARTLWNQAAEKDFQNLAAQIAEDCARLRTLRTAEPVRLQLGFSPKFMTFSQTISRVQRWSL